MAASDALIVGEDWISEHYFTTDAKSESFQAKVTERRKSLGRGRQGRPGRRRPGKQGQHRPLAIPCRPRKPGRGPRHLARRRA